MSLRTDRVDVVALIKKRGDLSQEEFGSKLFLSIDIVKNLLIYKQVSSSFCSVLSCIESMKPARYWRVVASLLCGRAVPIRVQCFG